MNEITCPLCGKDYSMRVEDMHILCEVLKKNHHIQLVCINCFNKKSNVPAINRQLIKIVTNIKNINIGKLFSRK